SVDEHAAIGIRELALLAAAALFRSAGLVVDDDRGALGFAEFVLDRGQIVTVLHRHARDGLALVARHVLGEDDDLLRAFGKHLRGDLADRYLAVVLLTAGHGDG